jgi:hypothetical protein
VKAVCLSLLALLLPLATPAFAVFELFRYGGEAKDRSTLETQELRPSGSRSGPSAFLDALTAPLPVILRGRSAGRRVTSGAGNPRLS